MTIDPSISGAQHPFKRQPGTYAVPAGLDNFILRLPNPTSGYNDRTRVENEVAALALARSGLQARYPGLIPRVFGWESARNGQGWMLQEYMHGSPLLDDFNQMSDDDRAIILNQMADILTILQQHKLPATIRQYGGLDFGPLGEYVSDPMSIFCSGPFKTYEEFVRATIESKLV